MAEINYFGKTDIGLVRPNNEDMFVIKPEIGFCLVSDGMGGAAAGELASQFFTETALNIFSNGPIQSEDEAIEKVQNAFRFAHEKILKYTEENPHHQGMGCTAELLAFHESGFIIGHIGDSRTYRLRNGQFKQLTKDHSLVQDQLDQGLITSDEAKKHSLRNVILRAVGINENLSLDILTGKIYAADLFLLCSDGLTDMIEDYLISQVLSSSIDLSQKTDKLIEMAKYAGGKDNITVVLAEIQ